MTETILQALDEVSRRVTAAGVPSAVDGQKLKIPGVAIYPAGITWNRVGGEPYELTVDLYVLARDNGPRPAVAVLGEMLTRMRSADLGVGDASFLTLSMANYGQLPAAHVQLLLQIGD